MKPLSGLDANYWYAESATSPMHVGSVVIIEGSLKFEDFRKLLEERIHLVPKLRQRLLDVPLSIDLPFWIDDPHFALDLHLNHIALPKPGGWAELRATASQIFSEHLDRTRPLWSFTFVEGLDKIEQLPQGSVAIISKIHQAAIDEDAGAGILSLLFDFLPESRKVDPPQEEWNPAPLPDELEIMQASARTFIKKPLRLPKLATRALQSSLKAGMLTRVQQPDMPGSSYSVPATILNREVSGRRKWNTAILDLARVKKLRSIMDVKLNDVLLTICSGALRRYLDEKKKLPLTSLVAMVPMSVKQDGKSKMITAKVQLATQFENPVERLRTIADSTERSKTYRKAVGARSLSEMAEAVPFGLANQAARLYSRYRVIEMQKPAFNVLITNVPGPPIPLYMNGHKVTSLMGMAPVIDGMGLVITIFSYNGQITLSPTADAKTMPDVDDFTRYLREAANELEAEVLAIEKDCLKAAATIEEDTRVPDFFAKLNELLGTEIVTDGQGIFQMEISGEKVGSWTLDTQSSPVVVSEGAPENPDAVIAMKYRHLLRIVEGEIDIEAAVIQGRIQIRGDQEKALPLVESIQRAIGLLGNSKEKADQTEA